MLGGRRVFGAKARGVGAVRRRLSPHTSPSMSPQGLLEQAGGCVPPAQCDCLHPSAPQLVAAGATVRLGCREW